MASTITLNNTITWAQQFVRVRPLQFAGLTPPVLEPALSSANMIKSTMLSAPFRWRWNRAPVALPNISVQDYSLSLATLGWIEDIAVQDAANPTSEWQQIDVKMDLSKDSTSGRPGFVAIQYDDNANPTSNLTLRFQPVPDKPYLGDMSIQKKPIPFAALTDTWAPIPDEFSFIYNWGFLALMYLYTDDAKFPVANQKFVASLLSVAEGLDETQRNIFLSNWQYVTGSPIAMSVRQTQGQEARGL